jgi:hypothetical protein
MHLPDSDKITVPAQTHGENAWLWQLQATLVECLDDAPLWFWQNYPLKQNRLLEEMMHLYDSDRITYLLKQTAKLAKLPALRYDAPLWFWQNYLLKQMMKLSDSGRITCSNRWRNCLIMTALPARTDDALPWFWQNYLLKQMGEIAWFWQNYLLE